MKKDKIWNELNDLRLLGCEDVRIGDLLNFNLKKADFIIAAKSFFRIILYSFILEYSIVVNGDPKTLSVFSMKNRQDHMKAFQNVIELIKNQLLFVRSNKRLNIRNLKYLVLPIKWMRQLSSISISLYEKLYIVSIVFYSFVHYAYIDKIVNDNKYNISFLISYFDIGFIECFFTQMYNAKGIKTVTLQHGNYDINLYPWSYAGSKSRFFLTDSQSSSNHAIKAGYSGTLVAVGSPHQLNYPTKHLQENFNKDTLGIVMNSKTFPKSENIFMIRTVQEFAKYYNKRVILKFHPDNDPNDYIKYINTDIISVLDKNKTLADLCSLIDIAIVCASTVFTSMLKNGIPILLFARKDHDIGLYENTDFLKFGNVQELYEKINEISSVKYRENYISYQNYFLCNGNYKDNYLNFFKEIGII